MANLGKSSRGPESVPFVGRVLEALLDLDALVTTDNFAKNDSVPYGRVEGSVAATLLIIHVFSNDLPVVLVEDLVPKDLVRLRETIENEPAAWCQCIMNRELREVGASESLGI